MENMENETLTALNDGELKEVSGGAYVGPCTVYTIKRGDTLEKIAAHFGTTVETLVQLNGIRNRNKIYAGHALLVPAR